MNTQDSGKMRISSLLFYSQTFVETICIFNIDLFIGISHRMIGIIVAALRAALLHALLFCSSVLEPHFDLSITKEEKQTH